MWVFAPSWHVCVCPQGCMCHGGCDCQGPWERVTFLAYDPVSTGRRVLVTEVGEGRGQFDGQHCLKQRNKMILRGRRLPWWRALRPGLPFPQARGAWEAAGLGAGGAGAGRTATAGPLQGALQDGLGSPEVGVAVGTAMHRAYSLKNWPLVDTSVVQSCPQYKGMKTVPM